MRLDLLNDLRRKIRVRRLELKLILADYLDYQDETVVEYNGRRYRVIRTYRIGQGEKITIRKAAESVLLALPHNISFYETLHNKMLWNADIRNR